MAALGENIITKYSSFPGCYDVSTGKRLPTFRRSLNAVNFTFNKGSHGKTPMKTTNNNNNNNKLPCSTIGGKLLVYLGDYRLLKTVCIAKSHLVRNPL